MQNGYKVASRNLEEDIFLSWNEVVRKKEDVAASGMGKRA